MKEHTSGISRAGRTETDINRKRRTARHIPQPSLATWRFHRHPRDKNEAPRPTFSRIRTRYQRLPSAVKSQVQACPHKASEVRPNKYFPGLMDFFGTVPIVQGTVNSIRELTTRAESTPFATIRSRPCLHPSHRSRALACRKPTLQLLQTSGDECLKLHALTKMSKPPTAIYGYISRNVVNDMDVERAAQRMLPQYFNGGSANCPR